MSFIYIKCLSSLTLILSRPYKSFLSELLPQKRLLAWYKGWKRACCSPLFCFDWKKTKNSEFYSKKLLVSASVSPRSPRCVHICHALLYSKEQQWMLAPSSLESFAIQCICISKFGGLGELTFISGICSFMETKNKASLWSRIRVLFLLDHVIASIYSYSPLY